MAPAARPCDTVKSVNGLPKAGARPPKTQRWTQLLIGQRISPKWMVVPLLFLCLYGLPLFLQSGNLRRAMAVAKGLPPQDARRANSLLRTGLHGTNQRALNPTCPSENEVRTERHFRLWDEKLEQALQSYGQGPPKTEEEAWHAVTDHVHVFSAFVATTTEHAIHITALVRSEKANATRTLIQQPPLVCIIRTSNQTVTRTARIRQVWAWFNPVFWNALILCPPPNETSAANEKIRVAVAVEGAARDSLRWLQLHRPPETETVEEKCCSVCVRPIFGYNISLWKVVEFVTHYRTLGAERFYFYDFDMSSGVKLLLARLQSAGVDVTLVPFKLIANTDDVNSHGQMLALYDCIFRSMSRTEYYIHVDLDELIVPARHSSIPALVREVELESDDSLGSLVVSNRYVCYEYPLNIKYSDHKYLPLQSRLFTFHNKDMPYLGFTKHIGRSRAICETPVHTVARPCGTYRAIYVNSTVAFMNHYRRCCDIPAEHESHRFIRLMDIRDIAVDQSFSQLSERIERDEVVRLLRNITLG